MNPALDSRARFEAHWRTVRGAKKAANELRRHPTDPQVYINDSANRHFVTWGGAWQAAIASMAAKTQDRAQVLDLIFANPAERVASLLESGVDGLGDTWHRFEVSDGQERRGVILTVTQLKPTPQDPPIAAPSRQEP